MIEFSSFETCIDALNVICLNKIPHTEDQHATAACRSCHCRSKPSTTECNLKLQQTCILFKRGHLHVFIHLKPVLSLWHELKQNLQPVAFSERQLFLPQLNCQFKFSFESCSQSWAASTRKCVMSLKHANRKDGKEEAFLGTHGGFQCRKGFGQFIIIFRHHSVAQPVARFTFAVSI